MISTFCENCSCKMKVEIKDQDVIFYCDCCGWEFKTDLASYEALNQPDKD